MDGIEVLYEDNHLLVLSKPAGMLTQDSGRDEISAEALARDYVKRSRNKPGEVYLHVVHRLDRDVSGVVLCATTSKALSRLNEQIRRRSARKIYCAVVEGAPPAEAGTLEHWLAHDRHHARVCAEGDEGARRARLSYRVLGRDSGRALVEVELETGRYHQIRAQLAAAGCPIVGDGRYGGSAAPELAAGIALHHVRLEIEHPVRREPLSFEAPEPPGWPWPGSTR